LNEVFKPASCAKFIEGVERINFHLL
jgi:hypothetical protein